MCCVVPACAQLVYTNGEAVMKEGEISETLYILYAGTVAVYEQGVRVNDFGADAEAARTCACFCSPSWILETVPVLDCTLGCKILVSGFQDLWTTSWQMPVLTFLGA